MWVLFTTLWGCGGCNDQPAPIGRGPVPIRQGSPPRTKAKIPPVPPVGAEGPVVGTLFLETTPADGGEGGDGEADPTPQKTSAALALTFGETGEAKVELGQVDGTCDELDPVPVGPEGKQHTPLWTVRCGVGDDKDELYILQIADTIAVIREVPPTAEGQRATYRPVNRVPLAKGALLQRSP